jgi:uncharacterized membrane protein
VSGFLSLLKNVIAGSPINQEQLMKHNGLLIIGVLLAKVLRSVDSIGDSWRMGGLHLSGAVATVSREVTQAIKNMAICA